MSVNPTATEALVVGCFRVAWVGLLTRPAAAPDALARAFGLPPGGGDRTAAFAAFPALLGLGVVRRWRWLFWLVLAAFLAGIPRVPVSLLELALDPAA
jgi:hypothetical protein